ncbi:Ribosomal protein S12p Asp88 (E. coli) methylthiotransferase [hydrothermal vent metagenome]|uniref:Ribosomal protein S12p Asp88 (E. coli) methylthiotransferase n=1 Tax=hydrothermal vent metagenome TaxID=652676 RepID=A0A3B1C9H0_9ZZZZ
MKVFLKTLGCPKNQVDSERILWALKRNNATLTGDERKADTLIINTCGFTEDAKQESIDAILALAEIKKSRPEVKLCVAGCLSQRYRDDLTSQIPEIDYIYGVDELDAIIKELADSQVSAPPDPDDPRRILGSPPHFAYLKISEGCSNNCSFCVIPLIRGPYKSRDPEQIVKEARQLAKGGVKELVVVAQDTTLYGADIRLDNGLGALLDQLSDIEEIEWIRVMYMYPPLVTDRLIERFSRLEKVVPYFDIPFQHASGRILAAMNREETERSIRNLVDKIRQSVPGASIRTSFIVGFKGETDKDFETLLKMVEDIRFDHLGAFIYSPEEESAAYKLPASRTPMIKARERFDRLMSAQQEISRRLLSDKVGRVMDVIVDGIDEEETLLTGRTKHQAPEIDGTVILDSFSAAVGSIIPVKIVGATDYDLIGQAPDI